MDLRYRRAGASAGTSSWRDPRGGIRIPGDDLVIGLLVVAAAVGGGLAGAHPTGQTVIDEVYCAATAGVITLAAGRASRPAVLILAAAGFALSRSWLFIPAAGALVLAFGAVWPRRPDRRLNALVGALASQMLLRWPSEGFHGLTALVAAAVALTVMVDGWRHCARRTRRIVAWTAGGLVAAAVVFTVPVGIGALRAEKPVRQGITSARLSLTTYEAGHASQTSSLLQIAAADLTTAHSDLSGALTLGGYLVPGVAQQERALSRMTSTGAALAVTAGEQASQLDLSTLKYTHGQIDLNAVRGFARPVETLDAALGSAQAEARAVSSPWLVAPLSDELGKFNRAVAKARSTTDLAVTAVKEAPALLGADGVRHYFIAFMSPAETRGLGGFIGAYGELTADNGKVRLTRNGRATELSNGPDPKLHLIAPTSYVAHYGSFNPQDYFEDLTYAPDLPTVAQVVDSLYPQVGGDQLDGVLVLDPNALASLLQFTGPLTLPGLDEPLTSANAAEVLLRQQYQLNVSNPERHDLLQDALKVGFDKLTTGSLPSPEELSNVLDPEVRQGRLLFYSNHPSDQVLLDQLHLLGYFPNPGGGDLLATTLANGGNDKIDAYVNETTSDDVSYDPATGHVTSTVSISLQNTASRNLPPYVIGSFAGSGLPPGTSLMWLNLYTPLRVTGATVDGAPFSFAEPIGEDGVSAYGGYVKIPSGSTVTLKVSLDGHVQPGPRYKMTLRLQPLATPQTVRVTAGGSTWTASADQVQVHAWGF